MKLAWRLLGLIVGLSVNFLGFAGANEQVATWAVWLADIHTWLQNPLAWFPITVASALVLSVPLADIITDYRLMKIGGRSKKEFKANLSKWDKINNFEFWQIPWLWIGLEPFDIETIKTPAYVTSIRIYEDIEKGIFNKSKKGTKITPHDTITRQELVNYAYNINEFPKFLFVKKRNHLTNIFTNMFRNSSKININEYANHYEYERFISEYLLENNEITSEIAYKEARLYTISNIIKGNTIAIGKEKINGIEYEYKIIDKKLFKGIDYIWNIKSSSGTTFVDIRLKDLK